MADYQYINDTGVIVPDTSDLQADVTAEYIGAFGTDLTTNPESKIGVLITAEAVSRAEVVRNNAAVVNQINPNQSGGQFLKALLALTGVDAPAATFSVVPGVAVTGQPTFNLPIGSQAKTATGDVFESTAAVTFDIHGLAAVDFQALVAGPVPAAPGALNVVGNVLGWETVNNANAAVLGQVELSDPEIRTLRDNTLGALGSGIAVAVTSNVALIAGFHSQQFRENKNSVNTTIDGIVLVKNSIWSCVQGGTDLDVATALLEAKGGGCNWNGAVSVDVVEPASGQTYSVLFDRPTAAPVLVRVTIRAPASAIDPIGTTKQAVLDYANGLIPDQKGFVVGGSVSPFEIAGAVMSELDGVYVRKVEVALVSDGIFQTVEIPLALNELATVDSGSITVVLA